MVKRGWLAEISTLRCHSLYHAMIPVVLVQYTPVLVAMLNIAWYHLWTSFALRLSIRRLYHCMHCVMLCAVLEATPDNALMI